MIRRTVSAAFLLRDGFTRHPLSSAAAVIRPADGGRCPVVRKEGGWLVLTDLPAGRNELILRCAGFRDELLCPETGEGSVWEQAVDLTPDRSYPYPSGAAFLSLTLTRGADAAADTELWAGMTGLTRLTVTQAKAGQERLQLFCRGPRERLPLPGSFLLPGGKKPELLFLRKLDSSGEALVEAPPEAAHRRGEELIPVRRFCTDAGGGVRLGFPAEGTLWLFSEGMVREAALKSGLQELTWQLDAGNQTEKK